MSRELGAIQGQLQARRHWVWRGWELLVQQRQQIQAQPDLQACASTAYIEQGPQAAAESWQTDFAVSQQNGELLGLYNPQGELHWQPTKTSLWGQRLSKHADNRDPGLAFAGQLRDDEGGLCYNRFRYYDPQGACYISPDPIGILGGENNYGYVPNPVSWVDPLGLSSCELAKKMEKAGTSRPNNLAAHHIVGETSKRAQPARNILKKHKIDLNGADNGVFLPNSKNTDAMSGILHNGKHPDKYIDAVIRRIRDADKLNGKQGVLDELGKIKDILSSANRDASRYNIL
ncbi:RHS repeat-associated core domain-containing protein [Aeromonas salmonicida]|uniref:RHS repeat-associated core domain-containing protein n=1 Tax=Aeromonas salmonicida TaxID=645 RepID=UPI0030C8BC7B